MAAADGKAFSQIHLQELVYIAHGWCLAMSGQPLTGDRPEARDYGPEYRRLAEALVNCGDRPVPSEIDHTGLAWNAPNADHVDVDDLAFDEDERAVMVEVFRHYGPRPTAVLAELTRGDGTPWAEVFAKGSGRGRDISHQMIRDQFAKIGAMLGR